MYIIYCFLLHSVCYERVDWLGEVWYIWQLHCGAAAFLQRDFPSKVRGKTDQIQINILSLYVSFIPVFYVVCLTALFIKDGRPDRSYFSPDCFHLSQKAHTVMARSLWNNMVTFAPLGEISLIF